jgi:D-3-phosphoglycerate dehydrogenase / 2-oxoglutarate reductase
VEEMGGTRASSLDDIWAKADYISVHVPKTAETTHLLNKTVFEKCKTGVRLVNCARGGIIHEGDLLEALDSGKVAAAALDVFEQEPPAADHPLLSHPKTIVTPHLGASTEEAQVNVALDVAEQIRDFFKSGIARSAVNSPILRADILDPVKHYMKLSEQLGQFVRQLAKGASTELQVTAKGTLAENNIAPLVVAAIKGLLSVSTEGVNYVNAKLIAEKQGLSLQESKAKSAGSYTNQLVLTLKTESGSYTVAATLLGVNQIRIIQVQNFSASLEPTPYMLVAPHDDKPGMVAKIAQLLGESDINISSLQVGQAFKKNASVMLFNLDSPPSADVLREMEALPGVHEVTLIRL